MRFWTDSKTNGTKNITLRRYLVVNRLYYTLLFFLSLILSVHAQGDFPIDATPRDTISNQNSDENIFTIFSGKPGRAMMYSLVLPGAGQFYNRRYWKVPLALALDGTALYYVITNTRTYRDFDTCYRSLIDENIDPEVRYCRNIDEAADAFRIRNSARSNMELSWIFLLGAHVLQSLEAFIDRHLIDFDTDENLSFAPDLGIKQMPNLTLFTLRVPLSK